MSKNSLLIALGVLGKPYKLLGEIHFYPYNNNSEIILNDIDIYIGKDENKINRMYVDSYNLDSNIIKFQNVDSRELASSISKNKLFILRNQMPELPNNEYYLVDLIGCEVFDEKDSKIGIVKDVMPLPANDVLIVEKKEEEHLIPLIDDIVTFIDIKNDRIEIVVVPGLF